MGYAGPVAEGGGGVRLPSIMLAFNPLLMFSQPSCTHTVTAAGLWRLSTQ